ncbi:uncharacterized protein LAESUDRAFT_325578 [Laetiporus sulphureus 93-53]|uniref:Uncharacterized protein n=1 Tax=Laetiporus sulphureus 93-53 TaxID=1314785 RepID=A0A165CZA9_9APHY|nr:uncharacterized protein LAESUDRAFT_325578 [Laetiporus sulphureus 93-53]KZT03799.1 hypothetical protein LAESUDRAFT_325578 [Laetiporus sulphureus 93-53]
MRNTLPSLLRVPCTHATFICDSAERCHEIRLILPVMQPIRCVATLTSQRLTNNTAPSHDLISYEPSDPSIPTCMSRSVAVLLMQA